MKKEDFKILALLGMISIVLVAAVSILFHSSQSQPTQQKVGTGFVTQLCDANGSAGATTSVSYLTTAQSASTTLACYTGVASSIDMNLQYTASSTSGCLQWTNSFSNNDVDWYYENGRIVNSAVSVSEGANPLVHAWCPGTTATSTKNVTLTPVASKYTRVQFMPTSSNGTLYEQLILKNELQQ